MEKVLHENMRPGEPHPMSVASSDPLSTFSVTGHANKSALHVTKQLKHFSHKET